MSEITYLARYSGYEVYFVGKNGYFYNGKVNPLKETYPQVKEILKESVNPMDAIQTFIKYFEVNYK